MLKMKHIFETYLDMDVISCLNSVKRFTHKPVDAMLCPLVVLMFPATVTGADHKIGHL